MNMPRSDVEFVDGAVVSQRVRQVVDAIREYDPRIQVKWIPPAARKDGAAAFCLIYDDPGREPYIMFYVQNDSEMNEGILKRIIQADQTVNKVSISDLEAWEQTQRLIQRQQYMDAMEEAADIASHMLKTPLNTYRVNKDLVIKDGIPFNALRIKD